ncbi:MAG: protein-glutamate O-methyltransferase family protein [Anaerolineae bacterium]|nr:protein-glutamate O-methyltransferase family protein [Anaerolineae bacterium]
MNTLPLPLIPTDPSNWFAHNTMSVRSPSMLREAIQLNPDYPQAIRNGLERLAEALVADETIPALRLPAPDYSDWADMRAQFPEATWLGTSWFYAEAYLYRYMMDVVRWFETARDPFTPKKNIETSSDKLWHTLEEAIETRTLAAEERLGALLEFDLWGNRIDLSLAIAAAHGTKADDGDLLIDDTMLVVPHLMRTPGTVHFICDNFGTEFAMDCALADGLLENGHDVLLHVKMHPYFVSDTIAADVLNFWHMLLARSGAMRLLGERLTAAFEVGRLRIAPDFFWNSARYMWEMPAYLRRTFDSASLVIIKGDLNYRRLIGDCIYDPTTPFNQIVDDFPGSLLTLRTLKSDPIIGLPAGLAQTLDGQDEKWRTNGKRGLIQSRLR